MCTPNPTGGIDIGSCFGLGNIASLGQAISLLVMPVFSLATTAVVIYFLWGAFNYLKSGGNKEEIANAQQMITHAIIGFIILIFAFFILQYIPQFFNLTGLDIIK